MPGPDETEAENLKLVHLHYAAFGSGDVDGILARLDPGVELIVHDEHGMPEERIRGREEAQAFFEGIKAAVANQTVEIQEIRADGARVLATVSIGGTMRSTGMTGAIPAVHLFACHEGLITSIRTHRPDWKRYAEPRNL